MLPEDNPDKGLRCRWFDQEMPGKHSKGAGKGEKPIKASFVNDRITPWATETQSPPENLPQTCQTCLRIIPPEDEKAGHSSTVLAWGAIMKYYTLRGLTRRNVFVRVLQSGKSKIKVPAYWLLGEGPLPGLQTAFLVSPHMVDRELRSLLSL